jgi:hypothetical protein
MTPNHEPRARPAGGERRGTALRACWWMLRSRRTGRITIAQWPNIPLWAFIVLTIVQWASHPSGTAASLLSGFTRAALLIWAVDEIARGVNPFRRLLGLAVASVVVVSLAR